MIQLSFPASFGLIIPSGLFMVTREVFETFLSYETRDDRNRRCLVRRVKVDMRIDVFRSDFHKSTNVIHSVGFNFIHLVHLKICFPVDENSGRMNTISALACSLF